jgi:predicted O-methyltransferase YrrM
MASANLVKDIHNTAASSENPAEASIRPPGTTAVEFAVMSRDVMRKLRVDRDSEVLEIGCGTGILALPIARRARRFVGVDFAEEALDVLRRRFAEAGLSDRTQLLVGNVLEMDAAELQELRGADRVLVYATIHLARDHDEGAAFIAAALDLVAPGGRVLIGNVPLEELEADAAMLAQAGGSGRLGRWRAYARWIGHHAGFGRTRAWKLRALLFFFIRGLLDRRRAPAPPAGESLGLPVGYTVRMTRDGVEDWIRRAPFPVSYSWVAPAVGSPLFLGRADLVIRRDG